VNRHPERTPVQNLQISARGCFAGSDTHWRILGNTGGAELSMVWVGLGRDFSVFRGLGWVHYSRSTKNFEKNCVNAFKARLDKIWLHQAVKFDCTADLTATGNQSLLVILGWVGLGPNFSTCSGLGWVRSVS